MPRENAKGKKTASDGKKLIPENHSGRSVATCIIIVMPLAEAGRGRNSQRIRNYGM